VALPNQQHRVHPQVWPTCAHTYIFFYSSDNRIHKLGINSPSTTIVWLVIQYDSDLTRYDTTPTTSSVDPSLARSEPSPHQYPSLSSSLEGLIKIQKQCFISISSALDLLIAVGMMPGAYVLAVIPKLRSLIAFGSLCPQRTSTQSILQSPEYLKNEDSDRRSALIHFVRAAIPAFATIWGG